MTPCTLAQAKRIYEDLTRRRFDPGAMKGTIAIDASTRIQGMTKAEAGTVIDGISRLSDSALPVLEKHGICDRAYLAGLYAQKRAWKDRMAAKDNFTRMRPI